MKQQFFSGKERGGRGTRFPHKSRETHRGGEKNASRKRRYESSSYRFISRIPENCHWTNNNKKKKKGRKKGEKKKKAKGEGTSAIIGRGEGRERGRGRENPGCRWLRSINKRWYCFAMVSRCNARWPNAGERDRCQFRGDPGVCVCQGNFVPPVEVVKLRVLRVLGFEFLQLEIYSSVGYLEIRCFSWKKFFPEKPMMSSKYTSGNLYSLLFRSSRKDRIDFFFQELTKNHG